MNIYPHSKLKDDGRRAEELHRGSVLVQSPSLSAVKLCRPAQAMIEEAFHPFNPLQRKNVLRSRQIAARVREYFPDILLGLHNDLL